MRHTLPLLASVLLVVTTLASATTTPVRAQELTTCTPQPIGAPITLEGNSLTQTAPFILEGGTYTLDWTAPETAQKNVSIFLAAADGVMEYDKLMVNTITVREGRTYIYNVKRGTYYLKVTAPAKWTATLTPVS